MQQASPRSPRVAVPDVPGPVVRLCWKQKLTSPHALTRCDRRFGHGGRHSWEDTPDLWLSTAMYSHVYGITRHTVYKWLKRGYLTWYRQGQVTRIKNLPPDQHAGTDPPVVDSARADRLS